MGFYVLLVSVCSECFSDIERPVQGVWCSHWVYGESRCGVDGVFKRTFSDPAVPSWNTAVPSGHQRGIGCYSHTERWCIAFVPCTV